MKLNQYIIRDLSNDVDSVDATDYWNTFNFLKLHKNYKHHNYSQKEIEFYLENISLNKKSAIK